MLKRRNGLEYLKNQKDDEKGDSPYPSGLATEPAQWSSPRTVVFSCSPSPSLQSRAPARPPRRHRRGMDKGDALPPLPPWPHSSSTPPPRSTSPPRSLDPGDLDEVRCHGHHDRPRPHGHCPPCGLGACRGAPNAFATSSAPTRSSPAPPHRRRCRLPQPWATATLPSDPRRPELPCLPLGRH